MYFKVVKNFPENKDINFDDYVKTGKNGPTLISIPFPFRLFCKYHFCYLFFLEKDDKKLEVQQMHLNLQRYYRKIYRAMTERLMWIGTSAVSPDLLERCLLPLLVSFSRFLLDFLLVLVRVLLLDLLLKFSILVIRNLALLFQLFY